MDGSWRLTPLPPLYCAFDAVKSYILIPSARQFGRSVSRSAVDFWIKVCSALPLHVLCVAWQLLCWIVCVWGQFMFVVGPIKRRVKR